MAIVVSLLSRPSYCAVLSFQLPSSACDTAESLEPIYGSIRHEIIILLYFLIQYYDFISSQFTTKVDLLV